MIDHFRVFFVILFGVKWHTFSNLLQRYWIVISCFRARSKASKAGQHNVNKSLKYVRHHKPPFKCKIIDKNSFCCFDSRVFKVKVEEEESINCRLRGQLLKKHLRPNWRLTMMFGGLERILWMIDPNNFGARRSWPLTHFVHLETSDRLFRWGRSPTCSSRTQRGPCLARVVHPP